MAPDNQDEVSEGSTARTWVSEHRYPVLILIAFVISGMALAPMVFTDVHWGRAVAGGALFGVFCTFCVALPRFLD